MAGGPATRGPCPQYGATVKVGTMLIRSSLVISAIGHLALIGASLVFTVGHPFDQVPVEAIAVDIVSPKDAGIDIDPDAAMPSARPDGAAGIEPTSPGPAAGAAPQIPPPPVPRALRTASPARQRAAQDRNAGRVADATVPAPPAAPSALVPPPQFPTFAAPSATAAADERQPRKTNLADVFALPLALPGGKLGGAFDAPAIDDADIGEDETAAFRQHVKTCGRLPGTLSPDDKVRIVLRVSLLPNATLAREPTLIEASASAKGPALMQSAVEALRRCQPYNMLPADKYKEWKVLDLSFSPHDLVAE